MIKTKDDYTFYLEADRIALAKTNSPSSSISSQFKEHFFKDEIWKFQKALRKLEFLKNKKKNVFEKVNYFFAYRHYQKLSYKLGFTIPPNVFGPGLSIAHYGSITINPKSRIGCNCRIHSGVNIGTEAGYANKAPTIGDNVYIGPGAKVFGAISIANNTVIGANAVVNSSFNQEYTTIGGIPSKIISENIEIDNFLIRATKLIEIGMNKNDISNLTAREIKILIDSKS